MAFCITWLTGKGAQVQKALLQTEEDSARFEKALSKAEATICEEAQARKRLETELEAVRSLACSVG